jgi:hypothetical protein
VTGLVARYTSSRWYSSLTLLAFGCAALTGWIAFHWPQASLIAWPIAAFAIAVGIIAGTIALLPAVEIHESHLLIGKGDTEHRTIAWREIRRVDLTRWPAGGHLPLAVYLTIEGGTRILMIHVGTATSSRDLLRNLRRHAHKALLDGIPYRQFWGDSAMVRKTPLRAAAPIVDAVLGDVAIVNAPTVNAPMTGETARNPSAGAANPVKGRLLLAEDEAEIERLFQRLKTAGHLDTPSLPQ